MLNAYFFESDTHQALRDSARRFTQQHIAPYAAQWEEAAAFPVALYQQTGAARILGIGYETSWGGAGGDLGHVLVAAEEMVLAGFSVGTAVGLGSHHIALPPIAKFGTPEQHMRFITPVLRGDKIAALAVTEPDAGSDVSALRTRARREGDYYVLHGSKTFITSGSRADIITCAVRTGSAGHDGLSLLVVERGSPGFHVGRTLRKMGWCASDTAELVFDGCRVPAHNLLGREGDGFAAMMANFVQERLLLAGQCIAIALLAYREAVKYARLRQAFGKPLAGFQVTRHKLADMATRIAAARAITGDATMRALRGEDRAGHAAMAKNAASDAASWVVNQAVQIHGGLGYMRESVVERLYRDVRLYSIGGGTREIMNEIIGKAEGY